MPTNANLKKKVTFLEYEVSRKETRPLPDKIEAIKQFKRPETIKQLRQFLGTINFYKRFIPGAAQDQATLNKALKGQKKENTSLIWTPDLEETFINCKESLAKATLLAHPVPSAELFITTDVSDVALAAVVHQVVRGEQQPLAFLSKKLSQARKKYSPYDRELLAIYTAVKHFRHLLEGREFTIYTDHELHTDLRLSKRLSG